MVDWNKEEVALSIAPANQPFTYSAQDLRDKLGITKANLYTNTVVDFHVRDNPSLSGKIVKLLQPGDKVYMLNYPQVNADGHLWARTEHGWVAADLLHRDTQSSLSNIVVTKLGFNVLKFSNTIALVASAKRLWDEGKPYGTMLVVDDVVLANQLLNYCPIVVFRLYDPNMPEYGASYQEAYMAGVTYGRLHEHELLELRKSAVGPFNSTESLLPATEHRMFVQYGNEPTYNVFDYAWWYGAASVLQQDGYRMCMFNDSMGNPTKTQFDDRLNALVDGVRLQDWMKSNGHVYGIHFYSDGSKEPQGSDQLFFAQRFNYLCDTYKPQIVVTECGQGDAVNPGKDELLKQMTAYTRLLKQQIYILGCCWWNYGTGGDAQWQRGDLQNNLLDIEALVGQE